MPVRVRCRCGQELVLRHGDWVYLCLGIVILALLVNSAALILVYVRLGAGVGGQNSAPAPDRQPLQEPPQAAIPTGEARAPASAPASAPAPAGPIGAAPAEPLPPPPTRPVSAAPSPAAADQAPLAVRPAEPPETAVAGLLAAPGPQPPASAPRAGEAAAASLEGPWSREPAFVRFLLLASRVSPWGAHVALLDPDPRLRARGGELLATAGSPPPGAEHLLAAAARRGQLPASLERLLANSIGNADKAQEALGEWWASCEARLAESPWRDLRAACTAAETRGIDIVLVVDVTQSMDELLDALRQQAAWLLAAWQWALPQSRVGAVLYRDAVEEVRDLSSHPLDDILPGLLGARAEGGGDVPEGVHVAIETALSLGHIRWRPGTVRHLVLLGDASPPHVETAGLVTLVRLAHVQGGYLLHACVPPPDPGESPAPFLLELARSAGGTAVTLARAGEVGETAFAMVFPAAAATLVRRQAAELRALFAPAARG